MTTLDEDESEVELSSIQAIFPEIIIDADDSHKAHLDLEVAPPQPLDVTFKPQTVDADPGAEIANEGLQRQTTRALSYLPALHIDIELPQGYPEDAPPVFLLRTDHDWIPVGRLKELEAHGETTWEECGRMASVFSYIDYLQTEAESVFGLASSGLTLNESLEGALILYDKQAKKDKFNQKTYDCGICLSPKRGAACYQMQHCGHVFCKECLQDFYNNAIDEGDIASVKCLDPDCGQGTGRNRKQPAVHPTELLDIPIERSKVQRYVNIKLKKMLENDKTTIYCPRKWCQAPARAAKYARYNPDDLEHWPEDDIVVEETPAAGSDSTKAKGDRLAICSKCQYAFCSVCCKGWHGDLINCLPPVSDGSMSAEDKASYDYIRKNTSPCPYCNSPAQKTHGCNHMSCGQCGTHFCYLCSAWLPAADPYRHFNTAGEPCFQRLWELEEGDEGQGGREIFAGLRAAEQDALALAQAALLEDTEAHAPQNGRGVDGGAGGGGGEQVVVNRVQVGGDINRVALQRFVAMALNDEEDAWDSDELAE